MTIAEQVREACAQAVLNGRFLTEDAPIKKWAEEVAAMLRDIDLTRFEPNPPFPNCKYQHCDLPGQCRSEGKCHHPKVPSDVQALLKCERERAVKAEQRVAELERYVKKLEAREAAHDRAWGGTMYSIDAAISKGGRHE